MGFSYIANMSITFSGFSSPHFVPTDYSTFSTYDNSNYIIDQSASNIIFTLSCNLPCKTCLSGILSKCNDCYHDISITIYIYLDTVNYNCTNSCPTSYYPNITNYLCTPCNIICLNCSFLPDNCTSCNLLSANIYLKKISDTSTCVSSCPTYYFPDISQNPVICTICISPCLTCNNASNCLTCIA